jgi:hypothetical protein
MNWEAIGVTAEVVGAIAVVVSLVYLAVQVRSNTRALRASSSFETAHSWASLNEQIVSMLAGDSQFQSGDESRLVRASALFYGANTKSEELTETERVIMSYLHRALFQKLEGQYFLYELGYLDDAIWCARRDWARGIIELPMIKNWWDGEVQASVYSREFVATISDSKLTSAKVGISGLT